MIACENLKHTIKAAVPKDGGFYDDYESKTVSITFFAEGGEYRQWER